MIKSASHRKDLADLRWPQHLTKLSSFPLLLQTKIFLISTVSPNQCNENEQVLMVARKTNILCEDKCFTGVIAYCAVECMHVCGMCVQCDGDGDGQSLYHAKLSTFMLLRLKLFALLYNYSCFPMLCYDDVIQKPLSLIFSLSLTFSSLRKAVNHDNPWSWPGLTPNYV